MTTPYWRVTLLEIILQYPFIHNLLRYDVKKFGFVIGFIIAIVAMLAIPIPISATINHVITGDTQKYRIFEGQAPTMQPSDAGMATNPMPGTFEWWYMQGQFTDGSKEQITFLVKPWFDNNGPLQPYATIAITTPNGTHLGGEAKVDVSQFNAHAIH